MPIGCSVEHAVHRLAAGVVTRPAGPAPSRSRPARGSRSRRRPRRCAAPRCGSTRRPRSGRACRRRSPAFSSCELARSCPAARRSTSPPRPGSSCRSPGWRWRRAGAARPRRPSRANRKVTARSRRWYLSASTTSTSQNSSIRSRRSTTVTLVPSAANIEAYSMPITPAPTTTIDCGTRSRRRMPSESMMVALVELHAGRSGRLGAGGDDDLLGGDLRARGRCRRSPRSCAASTKLPDARRASRRGCGRAGCGSPRSRGRSRAGCGRAGRRR